MDDTTEVNNTQGQFDYYLLLLEKKITEKPPVSLDVSYVD